MSDYEMWTCELHMCHKNVCVDLHTAVEHEEDTSKFYGYDDPWQAVAMGIDID